MDTISRLSSTIQSERKAATFVVGGHIPFRDSGRTLATSSTSSISSFTPSTKRLRTQTFTPNPDEENNSNISNDQKKRAKRKRNPVETQEDWEASTWKFSSEDSSEPRDEGTYEAGYENSTSPTVTIRWDSDNNMGHKLVLPWDGDQNGDLALQQLTEDCRKTPSGAPVFDDNHHGTTTIDSSRFCTDLSPYTLGIVDTVCQVLLPCTHRTFRGARAELRSLSVYSTRSSKLDGHTNAPHRNEKGISPFASLIVGLPCALSGGSLLVRRGVNTKSFDWGSSNTVSYIAFYRDCLYEVQKVVDGHCIGITYDLYAEPGPGMVVGNKSTLSAQTLPLYEPIKDLHSEPGTFGVLCSYYYAHTENAQIHRLPASLKGIDMVIYEICRDLGFSPKVLPILIDQDVWEKDGDEQFIGESFAPTKIDKSDLEDDYALSDLPGNFTKARVKWLAPLKGSRNKKGLAMASLGYCDGPTVDGFYTAACIIFHVP